MVGDLAEEIEKGLPLQTQVSKPIPVPFQTVKWAVGGASEQWLEWQRWAHLGDKM